MILFCDTSAVVKIYVQEDASDKVIQAAERSDCIAVSPITWVEFMSAIARRSRERPQDAVALAEARLCFVDDWPRYLKIEADKKLLELAGDHADTFALRAYDSVQLASAQTLHSEMRGEVSFACFDARLSKAARVLGMVPLV